MTQEQIHKIYVENARRTAEAKANAERITALEREHMQLKIKTELIANEQKRQAAVIAKHEEQLAKLEFRISEAERTIAHFTPLYEALKSQYDELVLKIKFYEQRGLLTGGAKRELERISNKLYSVETKINKAKFDKEQAERKIA